MIISSAPSKPASPISSKVSSSENMKKGQVAASTGAPGDRGDRLSQRSMLLVNDKPGVLLKRAADAATKLQEVQVPGRD
jgi:hypothetical protein